MNNFNAYFVLDFVKVTTTHVNPFYMKVYALRTVASATYKLIL